METEAGKQQQEKVDVLRLKAGRSSTASQGFVPFTGCAGVVTFTGSSIQCILSDAHCTFTFEYLFMASMRRGRSSTPRHTGLGVSQPFTSPRMLKSHASITLGQESLHLVGVSELVTPSAHDSAVQLDDLAIGRLRCREESRLSHLPSATSTRKGRQGSVGPSSFLRG